MSDMVTTIEDVEFFTLRNFQEERGNLVPIEGNSDISFNIERLFYVYGSPIGVVRGQHAHKKTDQVLIAVSGKCVVTVKDSQNSIEYVLDKPHQAVYVPAGIWGEQQYSEGTVLLVLCSTSYDKNDYMWDFDEYLSWYHGDSSK
jgi:dTDP-4-dehydrorhamnose 3,5-epimerase-like enzyme